MSSQGFWWSQKSHSASLTSLWFPTQHTSLASFDQLSPIPYLPQRTSLLREEGKVLLRKRDGGEGLQAQSGPALEEAHKALEGIQAQPVISVIGQMGHEDADLHGGWLHVSPRQLGWVREYPLPLPTWLAAPYRIKEHREKKLSTTDAPVQFLGASRILIVEDGVSEEATCLSWQHLGEGRRQK